MDRLPPLSKRFLCLIKIMLQKICWTVWSLFWREVIIDKIYAVLVYFTTLHRFHEDPRTPLKYIHISEQQQEHWHAAVRPRAALSVKVGVTSELRNPSSEWQSADRRQKRGAKCINIFSFGKFWEKETKKHPRLGTETPSCLIRREQRSWSWHRPRFASAFALRSASLGGENNAGGGRGWLSELKDGAQVSAPSFKLGDAWPCTRGSTMESAALQREVFT